MNYWKIIQDAFYEDLSEFKRKMRIFNFLSYREKNIFIILFSLMFFIFAYIVLCYFLIEDDLNFYLLLNLITFPFLYTIPWLNKKEKALYLSELKKQDCMTAPTQGERYDRGKWCNRGIRYLLFKTRLCKAAVTPEHIQSCFPLLEMDIITKEINGSKISLIVSIISLIVAIFFKSQFFIISDNTIIFIFSIIIFIFVFYFIVYPLVLNLRHLT